MPTNRTASFTSNDAYVYIWVNFTNVQASHTVTFDWILPNGTQYTNVTLSLPGGYVWVTANSDIPVVGYPAANISGQWMVQTYIDGLSALTQPFYMGTYTSPLTIVDSALSLQQNSTGYPIGRTIFYNTTSTELFSYVLFSGVGSQKYNVTWDFVTPQGNNFANLNQTLTGPSAEYNLSTYLLISGHPASTYTGLWYVLIYVNDDFTSPVLVQPFYISTPG